MAHMHAECMFAGDIPCLKIREMAVNGVKEYPLGLPDYLPPFNNFLFFKCQAKTNVVQCNV